MPTNRFGEMLKVAMSSVEEKGIGAREDSDSPQRVSIMRARQIGREVHKAAAPAQDDLGPALAQERQRV